MTYSKILYRPVSFAHENPIPPPEVQLLLGGMARTPQKLSRAEVQARSEKFLLELRASETQKEFDWIPELIGLMEELLALSLQDSPDQSKIADLSRRIHDFVRHPGMKGVGNIQHWVDSLVENDT